MKPEYRRMMKNIERNAYKAALTKSILALFCLSLLLLIVCAFHAFQNLNNQNSLGIFVTALIGGVTNFFASLIWYVIKAREFVRAESLELDLKYPGFFDYYQERQAKIDEITFN